MSRLRVRARRITNQSRFTPVDWGNPLTRGLQACYQAVGARMLDAVANRHTVRSTGTPTQTYRPRLGGAVEAISNSTLSADHFGAYQLSSGYTFLISLDIDALDSNYGAMFTITPDATGTTNITVLQRNSVTDDIAIYHDGTAAFFGNAVPAIVGQGPKVVAVKWDGTGTYLYIDGKLFGSTGQSTPPPAMGIGGRVIFGADRTESASYGSDGRYNGLLIYNRVLSDAEIVALSADPWRVLRRTRPRFIASLSTGISGTLGSSLGSVSVASTGALALKANAAPTLGKVSLAATSALAIAGSLSRSLGPVTVPAVAKLNVSAQAAASLGYLSVAATSRLALSAQATVPLGSVGLSATSGVAIAGQAATYLGPLSLTANSVTVAFSLGTASLVLGGLSVAATSGLAIAGSATALLGSVAASGTGRTQISAIATVSLGPVSTSGAGSIKIGAMAAPTLGNLGLVATAGSTNTGQATVLLGTVQVSAAGSFSNTGRLAAQFGTIALSATANFGLVLGPVPPERRIVVTFRNRRVTLPARPRRIIV